MHKFVWTGLFGYMGTWVLAYRYRRQERANPSIKIEDVCTLHRGVSTFLILGWGPNIPTLVPRNTVRLGFMPFFMPVPEGGVR